MTNYVWARAGRMTLTAAMLLLAACSTRYQAPLDDQSAVLDRSPPPIYSTTTPSAASGVVISGPAGGARERSGVSTSSGVPANTGSNTGVAAGVRVEPAP